MAATLKDPPIGRQRSEGHQNRFARACVATSWAALGERIRSALAPTEVIVQQRIMDLLGCADCDVYVIDTKVQDIRLWPAPVFALARANPLWVFLAASAADLRRVSPLPADSLVFGRTVPALGQLVAHLEARSDPEAAKRFARVDYLGDPRAFLVRFESGSVYLLELDELPEADHSAVAKLSIDRGKHHFSVTQESGNYFEVPWDDVLYHCEPGYEFYKGRVRGDLEDNRAKRIGERVRDARQARGLTVSELAKVAGMRRPNLSRLEHGRHSPSLDTLERIADALALPVAQLVAGAGIRPAADS